MTSQIDLSKFVGKKVRVTFNNKRTLEDFITLSGNYLFPYEIGSRFYDIHGRAAASIKSWDIHHIEEIKMPKYQELEQKIQELQAEVDLSLIHI